MKGIVNDKIAIGYEAEPLYRFFEFGMPDVILTYYWLKDGRTRAYIRLRPELEHLGSGERDRGRNNG